MSTNPNAADLDALAQDCADKCVEIVKDAVTKKGIDPESFRGRKMVEQGLLAVVDRMDSEPTAADPATNAAAPAAARRGYTRIARDGSVKRLRTASGFPATSASST